MEHGENYVAGVPVRIFFFLFATLFLNLAASAAAAAETVGFRGFSINVPPAWDYSEEGAIVKVTAKDNSSIVVFSPDKLPGGQSLEEFAAAFSRDSKGGPPVSDGRGTFQFDYTNDVGAKAHVVISQADPELDSVFLIVIVGENHLELPLILNSAKTEAID